MVNHVRENKIIRGLAGTGKTKFLVESIGKRLDTSRFLFLCFNRHLKNDVIAKYPALTHLNTHTMHGLCHKILAAHNSLPSVFEGYDIDDTNELKAKDFSSLIHRVLNLDEGKIRQVFPDTRLLCVDEYQDFRDDYVVLVRKLKVVFDADLVIAGDPLQRIYSYQNKNNVHKINDNFRDIKRDFNIDDCEDINLQKNYRSNPAILLFINGFISKVFKNKTDLLYEIPDTKIKNKFERPGIRWFTSQIAEAEYVIKSIKKYGNSKRIAIISRWNRNLRLIKKTLQQEQLENNSISVTSIHKYKGKEADIVFFVGFVFSFCVFGLVLRRCC